MNVSPTATISSSAATNDNDVFARTSTVAQHRSSVTVQDHGYNCDPSLELSSPAAIAAYYGYEYDSNGDDNKDQRVAIDRATKNKNKNYSTHTVLYHEGMRENFAHDDDSTTTKMIHHKYYEESHCQRIASDAYGEYKKSTMRRIGNNSSSSSSNDNNNSTLVVKGMLHRGTMTKKQSSKRTLMMAQRRGGADHSLLLKSAVLASMDLGDTCSDDDRGCSSALHFSDDDEDVNDDDGGASESFTHLRKRARRSSRPTSSGANGNPYDYNKGSDQRSDEDNDEEENDNSDEDDAAIALASSMFDSSMSLCLSTASDDVPMIATTPSSGGRRVS